MGKAPSSSRKTQYEKVETLFIIMSIFQLTFQECADMCMQYNCGMVPKTIEKL